MKHSVKSFYCSLVRSKLKYGSVLNKNDNIKIEVFLLLNLDIGFYHTLKIKNTFALSKI